jgi:NAD+ synthase (glutamine-hydrolysing)
MTELNIAMAQLDLTVGDINNNAEKMIQAAQQARDEMKADLIVFHELAICNYSPEDLLYHQDLYYFSKQALKRIACETKGIDVVVGYPEATGDVDNPLTRTRFNSAAWLRDGKVHANYRKQRLPNYSVFDERRYFTPGSASMIVKIKGFKVGMLICEDIWHAEPVAEARKAGAQLIVSLNASPFSLEKPAKRIKMLKKRIEANKLPMIYVNQVGGHDELLFDGGSMALDGEGNIICAMPRHEEKVAVVTVHEDMSMPRQSIEAELSDEASLYRALVLGVRSYVHKNGFKGALLGLSGGIDSALTLAIAVDALGAENVEAVLMPSQHTSQLSLDGALDEVKALGVKHQTLPIEDINKNFLNVLKDTFENTESGIAEQNIQARIRGSLLMALSNKTGKMVLTTGNKSEMAVGYATLYGDMAGGYAVLKDVYKTMVYRLSNYRNSISTVIPQAVIDRPPTAELAPDQKDEDSLPPYDVLDKILEMYIEQNSSIEKIIDAGFDADTVQHVIRLLTRSEYKRRQSPPGTRVTNKGFGRDWRYPITSNYVEHEIGD